MNKLRIGHLTTAYHTAFILMGKRWIHERLGLEPEWVLFATGPAMIRAFAENKLDLGYVGIPPTMIGMDRGLPLKCVAGGHMEGTVIVAGGNMKTSEDVGNVNETLEQLKGKTVGTPTRGSIHDVIVRTMLEEAGLQQDVEVKNFDWADLILYAAEKDEVQAAAGTPALAVLANQLLGFKMMLPPTMTWPHNPSYGIVTTSGMIESSSEILAGFLALHERACNLIRKQPHAAARIVSKAVRIMDEDFVYQIYRVSPKYCASLPPEYIQSTMAFVPVLQKMKYITHTIKEQDVFHKVIIEKIHKLPAHYDDPLMLA